MRSKWSKGYNDQSNTKTYPGLNQSRSARSSWYFFSRVSISWNFNERRKMLKHITMNDAWNRRSIKFTTSEERLLKAWIRIWRLKRTYSCLKKFRFLLERSRHTLFYVSIRCRVLLTVHLSENVSPFDNHVIIIHDLYKKRKKTLYHSIFLH